MERRHYGKVEGRKGGGGTFVWVVYKAASSVSFYILVFGEGRRVSGLLFGTTDAADDIRFDAPRGLHGGVFRVSGVGRAGEICVVGKTCRQRLARSTGLPQWRKLVSKCCSTLWHHAL